MNKNKFAPLALASLLMLAGCDYNDKNFEGLEEATQPTNVIKKDYTLTEADYATIGGTIKTNMYFSDAEPASKYLPKFFADKYFSADDGSSVKVTFNFKEEMSPLLKSYASVKYLKLTDADYKLIYGDKAFAPYLSAKNESQLYKVLNENFKDAEAGTVVFAEYKKGEGQLDNPQLWEGFESLKTGNLEKMDNWFISATGNKWTVTSFDDNQYAQYTANKSESECVAWMVSPAITATASDYFGFDVNVGYYNANCLSVLISENFDGKNVATATWKDVTADFDIPTKPTGGYGVFASAGKTSLSAYAGKKINIAFKYVGDAASKKTTTYQIDNIMVGSSLPADAMSTPVYVVNILGKSWGAVDKNVYVLSYEDYAAMGQSKRYFTADAPAKNYLPAYLAQKVAYPQNEEARVVIYRNFNGTALKIYSDEYVYSAETNRWALNTRIVEKTEQYVLGSGKWNFDPSTVIDLPAVKGDAMSVLYFKTIIEWVKGAHSEYVNSYGDSEYYYGASSYNCNFDFRASTWKSNVASAYGDMTNEALEKLMKERLPESFIHALEKLNADAVPVEGVEVIYTVNFAIYNGTATTKWTVKYLVTAPGKFEYIADSLKELK